MVAFHLSHVGVLSYPDNENKKLIKFSGEKLIWHMFDTWMKWNFQTLEKEGIWTN